MTKRARTLIVVIDDDPDVLDAMELVLQTAGHDVKCALSGAAALEMMRNGSLPALVITDLMMPEMTGWDLIEKMRDDEALRAIPIIASTASFGAACPEGVILLKKPFELQTLLDVIDRYAAPAPPDSEPRSSTPDAPRKRPAAVA